MVFDPYSFDFKKTLPSSITVDSSVVLDFFLFVIKNGIIIEFTPPIIFFIL